MLAMLSSLRWLCAAPENAPPARTSFPNAGCMLRRGAEHDGKARHAWPLKQVMGGTPRCELHRGASARAAPRDKIAQHLAVTPSTNPLSKLVRRAFSRWTATHWVRVGLAFAVCIAIAVCALLAIGVASIFDTTQTLKDFASPAEARAFTSAHLPVSLPEDATVESLTYERWTDWHFSARVRLPSSEAVDRYLDQARAAGEPNAEYCNDEPSSDARYFLKDVSACGSVHRESLQVLEVVCYTR